MTQLHPFRRLVDEPTVPQSPAHPNRINFGWLVRLRWSMIAGQLLTIVGVRLAFDVSLPMVPLLGLVGVEIALNVVGAIVQTRREPREWWLAGIMACDIALCTGLLSLTGGPSNPFSFLYLVQIALAAITVRAAWSWALTALALLGSAILFLSPQPLPFGVSHAKYMDLHLRGMWVAFGVAAAFIVYFLFRVRHALEQRDLELNESRKAAVRQERLASLATLAAGAAHELSTPLATIAVAVKELERHHASTTDDPDAMLDIRLIREQVDRCRTILERMSTDAGENIGETPVSTSVFELVEAALAGLPSRIPIHSNVSEAALGAHVRVPRRALVQSLKGLLKNAQEASPEGGTVGLKVGGSSETVVFEIEDSGRGMSPSTLERIGEPFFTTKAPGKGMGLGVFLARAVVEPIGGHVLFQSVEGKGTTALVRIPAVREPGPTP